MTKICKTCNIEKSGSDYHKGKRYAGGLRSECKACHNMRQKRWNQKNPVALKKIVQKYYHSSHGQSQRKLNLPKIRATETARVARRRALKRDNTPHVTIEETRLINSLYTMAKILSNSCGEEFHIDHIQPISKGGPHTFENLQILSAEENLTKSNKWES